MLSGLTILAAAGCQFPDYDLGEPGVGVGGEGAQGGSPVGAAGGGAGAPEPDPTCDPGQLCATTVPERWLGPVALWEARVGQQSEPPECPKGYGEPSDFHRELKASAAACTCACSAGAQVCDKPAAVSIYDDRGCQAECSKPTALACSTVSGCNGREGSLRADRPTPSGTCTAKVAQEIEAASWQYDVRLCQLTDAELPACTDGSGQCAPTPALPYTSQLCVVQVVAEGQPLPACPAEYPNGGDALYTDFSDDRGCSACTCDGLIGGSCSGTLTLTDGQECSNTLEYTLGSGCKQFGFGTQPTHLSAKYTLQEPGTCGVARDTKPTGDVLPKGSATVVCCL